MGYGTSSLVMNTILLASYHTRASPRILVLRVATDRALLRELEGIGPDVFEYIILQTTKMQRV